MTLQSDSPELAAFAARMQRFSADLEALTDATFPQRVRLREEAARLGYQGERHGWYPHKPRGWRP